MGFKISKEFHIFIISQSFLFFYHYCLNIKGNTKYFYVYCLLFLLCCSEIFQNIAGCERPKKKQQKKQMQYSCCKSFTTLPTQNSEVAQNHNYKKKKNKKIEILKTDYLGVKLQFVISLYLGRTCKFYVFVCLGFF